MIQLEEWMERVDQCNYTDELKSALKAAAEPCFGFREYLMNKLNISDVQVEALIEAQVASKAQEMNEELKDLPMDLYIDESIARTVDVVCDFAHIQKYPEVEALRESLIELLKFTVNQEIAYRRSNN